MKIALAVMGLVIAYGILVMLCVMLFSMLEEDVKRIIRKAKTVDTDRTRIRSTSKA